MQARDDDATLFQQSSPFNNVTDIQRGPLALRNALAAMLLYSYFQLCFFNVSLTEVTVFQPVDANGCQRGDESSIL